MIRAGNLRWRLAVSAKTVALNPIAQEVVTWSPLATISGERLASQRGEREELKPNSPDHGPGTPGVATARYRVRWRPDLALEQRVVVGGLAYVITGIEEPDLRESLILTLSGDGSAG